MGFELPNGKTARNIQEQVKFLTEKLKDLYARVNDLEIKIEVVDELPEEGVEGTIYLVPVENPDTDNYYEEYLYLDGAYELIGTTQIDLSNYVDLTSAQTITGAKTIEASNLIEYNTPQFLFADTEHSQYRQGISSSSSYTLLLGKYTSNGSTLQSGLRIGGTYAAPVNNNDMDLGDSSHYWKDLYLSGNFYCDSAAIFNVGGTDYLEMQLGSIIARQTFRPNATNTRDLGTSSFAWKDLYLSGSATLSSIKATDGNEAIKVSGTATSVKWFYPYANNVYDIGSSSFQWKDLYLSGTARANQVIATYFGQNGSGALFSGVRFSPESNSGADLGASSYQWKDLYLSGNLTDGTNSVSVAQLAAFTGAQLYKHVITLSDSNTITVITNDSTDMSSAAITALANFIKNALSAKYNGIYDILSPGLAASPLYLYFTILDYSSLTPTLTFVSLRDLTISSDTVSAY